MECGMHQSAGNNFQAKRNIGKRHEHANMARCTCHAQANRSTVPDEGEKTKTTTGMQTGKVVGDEGTRCVVSELITFQKV
jgi:hypothetical protein